MQNIDTLPRATRRTVRELTVVWYFSAGSSGGTSLGSWNPQSGGRALRLLRASAILMAMVKLFSHCHSLAGGRGSKCGGWGGATRTWWRPSPTARAVSSCRYWEWTSWWAEDTSPCVGGEGRGEEGNDSYYCII